MQPLSTRWQCKGVDILTSDDALIHSSGHPRQEELAALYDWLQPTAVVPMHGEPLHLKRHAEFAIERGIADTRMVVNGQLTRLQPGPVEIVDEVEAGRILVDGHLLTRSADSPARERRKMSFSGIVSVSVVLNKKGDPIAPPLVDFEGVPETDAAGEEMLFILEDAVADALDNMTRAQRRKDDTVVEMLRNGVRRTAQRHWGKRPRCQVLVHRI